LSRSAEALSIATKGTGRSVPFIFLEDVAPKYFLEKLR